jgi:alkylated DNA repair protein (DNA oxidative demethylase)
MHVSGLEYLPDFLSIDEEREILSHLAAIDWREVKFRGVVARRRTAHFGVDYTYNSRKVTPTTAPPAWLEPLMARVEPLLGGRAGEVLFTEYPPGAGIGWHRDAPAFGPRVAGVSLGAAARLRFKRLAERAELVLQPRSAYVLAGEGRSAWQHMIPPGRELRYSLTFRTLFVK